MFSHDWRVLVAVLLVDLADRSEERAKYLIQKAKRLRAAAKELRKQAEKYK
jgi:hypothetical protein